MEPTFKHLDLIAETGVDEKLLFKDKVMRGKIQGFQLAKGRYDKDANEKDGLRAEKLSDELFDLINDFIKNPPAYAAPKPAKAQPTADELADIAAQKAEERILARQKAEADKLRKEQEAATAKAEADRVVAEQAQKDAEAAAEAARLAKENDDAAAAAKAEEERVAAEKAAQEAQAIAAKAEADRLAAEKAAQEAAQRDADSKNVHKTLFGW